MEKLFRLTRFYFLEKPATQSNSLKQFINQKIAHFSHLVPPIILLSGLMTILKMGSNLLVGKTIATYGGSVGVGIMGQLTNSVNLLSAVCLCFSTVGLSNLISTNQSNPNKVKNLINSALVGYTVVTICVTLLLIGLANFIWPIVFISAEYKNLIYVSAVCIFAHAARSFLLAVVNGFKDSKSFLIISGLNSVVFLTIVGLLTVFYGIYGALFGYITYQIIALFFALLFTREKKWLHFFFIKIKKFSFSHLSELKIFVLSSLITTISIPLSQLLIRTYIAHDSLENAGYWESLNRISVTINLLIASSLQVYILNYVSHLDTKTYAKHIEKLAFRVFLIVLLSTTMLYSVRYLFIAGLFSKDFIVITPFLKFYLVGDVFKSVGWILTYSLMVRKKISRYIFLESFIGSGLLTVASISLYSTLGLLGSSIAYMTSCIIYSLFSIFYFRRSFNEDGDENLLKQL